MALTFIRRDAREQATIDAPVYDRWVTPDNGVAAEFRRLGADRYHMRFCGQADFEIGLQTATVEGWPTPEAEAGNLDTLFHNSVQPVIGNHQGELHLHGSAVATPLGAIAFLGLSRRGKTTLAGAFARAGHPFLTEDVLSLEVLGDGYVVAPKRPELRLFADSASWLTGADDMFAGHTTKQPLPAGEALPCATSPAPLRAICLLGPGEAATATITPLGAAAALTQLMGHAFVLDVEDRARLRGHFHRLADLAALVPCHALDYPRTYAHLPQVIATVLRQLGADPAARGA